LPRYRRVVLVAAATVLALLGLPATGAAKTVGASKHYVALGDSYASGPGIPEQRADPVGCQRSTHNHPALLADAVRIRDYTDVNCGGARTDDLTLRSRCGRDPTHHSSTRFARTPT
jgi:hypothetical protein